MNKENNTVGKHVPHKCVGIIGHGGEGSAVAEAMERIHSDISPMIINCNQASMSGIGLNHQILDEVMKDLAPKQTLVIENLNECFQYTPTIVDEDKRNEYQHMLSCHKARKKRKRKKKGRK